MQVATIREALTYKLAFEAIKTLTRVQVSTSAQGDAVSKVYVDLGNIYSNIIETIIPNVENTDKSKVLDKRTNYSDEDKLAALESLTKEGPIKGSFSDVLDAVSRLTVVTDKLAESTKNF